MTVAPGIRSSATRPRESGPDDRGWDLSVIGFGDPLSPRTSSGYARGLCNALAQEGCLRHTYSARQIRLADVLRGAVAVRVFRPGPAGTHFRPYVRRAWMWSDSGAGLLGERVTRLIRAAGDHGAFLQVGTLVTLPADLGPHFMRTDMTIAQARRAGFFDVSLLSRRRLNQAEELQARVVASAAGLFAASQWVAESLHKDCGVSPERIRILYPSAPIPAEGGNHARAGRREILFVGLDWKRKGGPLLLEAFKLLQPRFPGITLRIVGCTPNIVDPAIHVEGRLDRRDPQQAARLLACYQSAACFCLPSQFEPFGISFVEAAMHGLPSVSIDAGSRREAILDGITGRLADPTPQDLAAALEGVLCDEGKAREMGQAARTRADSLFAWSAAIATIERTLLECKQRASTTG